MFNEETIISDERINEIIEKHFNAKESNNG